MGLFTKDTTAQKIGKTVKKMVKAIGPQKPTITERLFGKPPRVKGGEVIINGRDDDY